MKIAVLVKQVPGSESPLNIDSSEKGLDESQVTYITNESDNYAIEEALQICDKLEEGELLKILNRNKKLNGIYDEAEPLLILSSDKDFQQLQKYERGMNRISASKLWQISQVLDVPVQWFFEEFSEPKEEEGSRREAFHMKRETLELVRNYIAVPADVRRKFLSLVKSIANSAST